MGFWALGSLFLQDLELYGLWGSLLYGIIHYATLPYEITCHKIPFITRIGSTRGFHRLRDNPRRFRTPFYVFLGPPQPPPPPPKIFLSQLESSRRLSEIRTLHERSRSAAEEARRKEELYKQLVNFGGGGVQFMAFKGRGGGLWVTPPL